MPEDSAQVGVTSAREDRWRQDLRFLARELPRRHKNLFFHLKREDFERSLAELDQSIPSMEDDEIVVQLMRIVAAIGDGHTGLGWQDKAVGFHEFPLAVYWFEDGLYVVNTAPQYQQALGKRLAQIGEVRINEACARVSQLIPHDNEIGTRLSSPSYLMTPEVLHALAILPDRGKGRFVFADSSGNTIALELASVRRGEQTERLDVAKGPTPLYRTPTNAFYWYEYLADSRTLYFQYRVCLEMKTLSFSRFAKSLLAFADGHPVERFVVDLRLNPGGNERILQPFIHKLRSRPFNHKGRLFVIIGSRTASSAMDNALTFKAQTNALLVGQPTSGKPNAYGEVKKMTLPNTGLTVQYSVKYWRKLKGDPPYLSPDITAEVSFSDYQAGRDPSMEAILSYK